MYFPIFTKIKICLVYLALGGPLLPLLLPPLLLPPLDSPVMTMEDKPDLMRPTFVGRPNRDKTLLLE